jgi:septum formation protein
MKKDFIYLASASPRRSELLRQLGVRFEVLPADVPEAQAAGEAPGAYVTRLARAKAEAVWARLTTGAAGGAREARPVLAADTAVVIDERVLGKPADTAEAMAMLAELSGRTHRVLTAVALRCNRSLEALLCRSEVRFRATTDEERAAYCRSGEPFDKAGGYGIQGRAAMFIEHLSGSYSSVVGLPLFETAALLERCGVKLWNDSRARSRADRRTAGRVAVRPGGGDARTA